MTMAIKDKSKREEFGIELGKTLDIYPEELKGLLIGLFENTTSAYRDITLEWVRENFECKGKDNTTNEFEIVWS